jgi:hypothetical protein
MTSWWFALGDDAEAQLRGYAVHYLGVFGPKVAEGLASACTSFGPSAVRAAVDAAMEAGYDEIQLVPTSIDLTQLDDLTELLGDLLP